MKKFHFTDMKKGWFVGNFEPTAFKTSQFEIGVMSHKKGEMWDKHYHKKSNEITLFLKGKVKLGNEIFSKGDILLIEPNEIVDPEFLEDTEVVVIKTPSDTNDKHIIER